MLTLLRKTRIALEYACKHRHSDSVSVFWVYASTPERMEKAYQEIAKKATLVGAGDPKVDQFQLVKHWLESDDSGSWLMIIDNADDEKLFFGEDKDLASDLSSFSNNMACYLPQRSNGSVLLTTRNKKLGVKFAAVSGVITILKMSLSESKRLLLKNLEEDDRDDNDLIELAEVLENLPLALVQATAFIGENSQSIGEYLQTYHISDSAKIKLLSQNFGDNERDPDSKNPVAVTWVISFEQIRKNDHKAAEMLSLMSVFDGQAIPKSLLSSNTEAVEFDKALGTLKAFSLITMEQNRQAFNLHRLVYLATRNWLNMNEELDAWTGKALVLLSELFPTGTHKNQEIWMAYLPHAQIVLKSDQLPAGEHIAQATLLFNVSMALQKKGDYNPAEIMAQKCLDLREKVLGAKHPDTLFSLSNLSSVLLRKGKTKEAKETILQALDGFEKMLEKDPSYALQSCVTLGLVLDDQGEYEAAMTTHQRVLSIQEEALGTEDPHTLGSMSNLGLVLSHQGKYEAAEKLYRQVLSSQEKILGKEHPDTVRSVSNLGVMLGYQCKYKVAEQLHRRALMAREKIQGKEHPDTLFSVNALGVQLGSQGKYIAAEELHRRALSSREKILGKEHPETLRSVSNLAVTLRRPDQLEEAATLFRQALSGRENSLGKEHPDTLRSLEALATFCANISLYQIASQFYRSALAGFRKRLGSDHPDTQICAEIYRKFLKEVSQDLEAPYTSVIREDS